MPSDDEPIATNNTDILINNITDSKSIDFIDNVSGVNRLENEYVAPSTKHSSDFATSAVPQNAQHNVQPNNNGTDKSVPQCAEVEVSPKQCTSARCSVVNEGHEARYDFVYNDSNPTPLERSGAQMDQRCFNGPCSSTDATGMMPCHARSRLFRNPQDALIPFQSCDEFLADGSLCGSIGAESMASNNSRSISINNNSNNNRTALQNCCGDSPAFGNNNSNNHWQLFSVTLHRAHPGGFGIAVIGGKESPYYHFGDSSIIVSDVIPSGPAFGLLQVNDRIISANGLSLEYADYSTAIAVMKDSEQLNMIVKRRVPVPFVEFEQRTLKFTLSKSHKKDDFGIVLGCRYYIKEITNPKLAEKDPGLREGDTVLRVNGQSLESLSLEEASRLLHRSREKLSLVVQRDVRRAPGAAGSRWPSQTTVYERLGSISATPRQSPTPVHLTHSSNQSDGLPVGASPLPQHNSRRPANFSPGPKRYSDSVITAAPSVAQLSYPSPLSQHHNHSHSLEHQHQRRVHQANPSQQRPQPASSAHSESEMLAMNGGGQTYPLMNANSQQNVDLIPQYNNKAYPLNSTTQMKSQTPTSSIISASSMTGGGQSTSLTKANYSVNNNTNRNDVNYAHNFNNSSSGGASSLHDGPSQYLHSQNQHYQQQQQHQYGGVYPASCQPTSFALQSARYAAQSPAQRSAKSGGGIVSSHLQVLNFRKGAAKSLGIRVIGGNQVGIFVSVVHENTPAAVNGIKVGDRLHAVNGYSMNGITREQAVEFLLTLGDEVSIQLEHASDDDFSHIRGGKMGDSFYIRTHFNYQKRGNAELSFNIGDILHVNDTLDGGSVGYWQVTKVYSASETEIKSNESRGIIPNAKTAEILARQSRMDSTTLGRSLFRKKLSSNRAKTNAENDATNEPTTSNADAIIPPAYERVALKKPAFHRPVVLFGPLADAARQLLLTNYPQQFGAVIAPGGEASDIAIAASNTDATNAVDDASSSSTAATTAAAAAAVLRMSSIDAVMAAQRHCVLSISPGSVERLQLAQYAPIVILVDVDGKARVRELRAKAGVATPSARKLIEQAAKIKKHHSHLLTATLDASKEDGWFEALCHLIYHLQERRVWMPEFQPNQQRAEEVLLFPLQTLETPDAVETSVTGGTTINNSNNDCVVYDGRSSIQSTPGHKLPAERRTNTPGDLSARGIGAGFLDGHENDLQQQHQQIRQAGNAYAGGYGAVGNSGYNSAHGQPVYMQQSTHDFRSHSASVMTGGCGDFASAAGGIRPMSASTNSALSGAKFSTAGGANITNNMTPMDRLLEELQQQQQHQNFYNFPPPRSATSPRHHHSTSNQQQYQQSADCGAAKNLSLTAGGCSQVPKSPTPSWLNNKSLGNQGQQPNGKPYGTETSGNYNAGENYNDNNNKVVYHKPNSESVVTMNANFNLRRMTPSPQKVTITGDDATSAAPKSFVNNA